MAHDEKITVVSISHDGQTCLSGDSGGLVRLCQDSDRRSPRHELHSPGWIASAAFSPDDETAVIGVGYVVGVADAGAKALVWDTRTGKVVGDPIPHSIGVFAIAFSPDGRTFATGDERGARLWDRATRRPIGERIGRGMAFPAAFFPDGQHILLLSQGIANVWDVASGHLTGPPAFHPEGGILRVALSQDGRSIVIRGRDRAVRLWDVATGKLLGVPVNLDGMYPVAASSKSRRFAVAGSGGRVAMWNEPEPLEGKVERIRLWVELLSGMELDSRGAVSALSPEALGRHQQQLDAAGGPPAIPGS